MNRSTLTSFAIALVFVVSGALFGACKQDAKPANNTRSTSLRKAPVRKAPQKGAKAPTKGSARLSCRQRLDLSRKYVKAVHKKGLSCKSNADCAIIRLRTGCTGACPTAIAKSGVASAKAAIAHANKTWCATYRADGCPYKMVKCAVPTAICKQGVCVSKYGR